MIPLNHKTIPIILLMNENQTKIKEIIKLLVNECLKIACVTLESLESIETKPIVYSDNNTILLKEYTSTLLFQTHKQQVVRLKLACILIQSIIRMYLKRIKYNRIYHLIIKLQANLRGKTDRIIFINKKQSISIIKRNYKMIKQKYQYKLQMNAIKLIQKQIMGNVVQRLRYKRMKRVSFLLQEMTRGYIIRKNSLNIIKSIEIIKNILKKYIYNYRIIKNYTNSVICIQRYIRGWISREYNNKNVRILKIRKRQRIANQVIKKIQANFRRKIIQKRYYELISAIKIIQTWGRSKSLIRIYKAIKKVVIWCQCHWRRLKSLHIVSNIRMSTMMIIETNYIEKFCDNEIQSLINYSNPNDWKIGVGIYRNGHIKCTKRIIGYDVSYDLSDSYPNGYLITLLSFISNLKKYEKKTVTHIALGGEHTVIIDNSVNFYSFGISDDGQLGQNNRINYSQPKLMELMEITMHLSENSLNKGLKIRTKVINVACGRSHTLVLSDNGRIYSWGSNKRGQLGHSNFESSAIPRVVGHDNVEISSTRGVRSGSFSLKYVLFLYLTFNILIVSINS